MRTFKLLRTISVYGSSGIGFNELDDFFPDLQVPNTTVTLFFLQGRQIFHSAPRKDPLFRRAPTTRQVLTICPTRFITTVISLRLDLDTLILRSLCTRSVSLFRWKLTRSEPPNPIQEAAAIQPRK